MGKTAERRQMTVMFVDMVGSTQRLQNCDPEEFFEFIVDYQSLVKNCVAQFDGSVARLIGDGVLIYFGWPHVQEDGAARAIGAAREIVNKISDLTDPHGDITKCRIGIATGVVVVGEITTQPDQSQDEVFGETPHLAERLQSQSVPNAITVCHQTHSLTMSRFEFQPVKTKELKGIGEKQSIYTVKTAKNNLTRFVASRTSPELVTFGRDKELQLISELWNKSLNEETQVVWLSGDAGIGKSHLIEAANRNLTADNKAAIRYQCSRFHSQSPYYPFVRRTEIWAEMTVTDTPEIRLQKFLKCMGKRPNDEMLAAISPLMNFPKFRPKKTTRNTMKANNKLEEREAVCRSLMGILKIVVKPYSALILIEDIHWADPSTLFFVRYIATHCSEFTSLILITFRDEIEAFDDNRDNFHEIFLNPLNKSAATDMVKDIAGSSVPSQDILATIVERTDGIPLYVQACTKAFLDASKADNIDLSFQGKMDVPFSLHDVLMERLEQLGDAKQIAQLCSAIGHEFSAQLVEKISDRSTREVSRSLEMLTYAEILMRTPESDTSTYRFRHSLIQDVAYQGLLLRRRRQLHLNIARVLENEYPDLVDSEPEFIAEHYRAAQRYPEALEYLQIAASKSIEKFANREAIDHADQGIVLIRKLNDQSKKDELELGFQFSRAVASQAYYGYATNATIQAFQRIMELATKLENGHYLSRAIRGLFNALHAEGRYQDALEMAEKLIEITNEDLHANMAGHYMRALPLIWQGKFIDAKNALEVGIEVYENAEKEGDYRGKRVLTQIQSTLALAHAFLGNYRQAFDEGMAALDTIKTFGRALDIANCYLSLSNTLRIIRHPDALPVAKEFEDFVSVREIPYYSAALSAFVGIGIFENGELEAGLEMLQSGWEQFTKTDARINQVFYMAELADCHLRLGNLPEAKKAVKAGFELTAEYGELNFKAELHRIKGEIMVAEKLPNFADIADEFEASIAIAKSQSARIFEFRASLALAKLRASGEMKESSTAPGANGSESWVEKIIDEFSDLSELHEMKKLKNSN